MLPLLIHKPGLINPRNRLRKNRRIIRYKRLEVPRRRSRPSTPRIEVLGYNLVAESGIVLQFATHLFVAEFAGGFCFGRAFDDEFEALVEFVFDLLAVLEVSLWIVAEEIELFLGV